MARTSGPEITTGGPAGYNPGMSQPPEEWAEDVEIVEIDRGDQHVADWRVDYAATRKHIAAVIRAAVAEAERQRDNALADLGDKMEECGRLKGEVDRLVLAAILGARERPAP